LGVRRRVCQPCGRCGSVRVGDGGRRRVRVCASASKGYGGEVETHASLPGEVGVEGAVAQRMRLGGVHHVAVICADLGRALDFYCGLLGLAIQPGRREDKLPFRGAFVDIGGGHAIHLMELPNPDPTDVGARPEHGGRDRHVCMALGDIAPLAEALDSAGVPYTMSKSGRKALFTRDPDCNTLEFFEL